jgi:23S rRNA (adenine2503-C2)-methyltransferase
MDLPELTAAVKEMGQPAYRAGQIFSWLHKSGVASFDEMTNLPKTLREALHDNFVIFGCAIEKKLISEYDETVKYLFRLHDGEFIESVLMKYRYGWSVCVSSQVGCRMGCKFCASTMNGVVRSLAASEILSQVYAIRRDARVRVSHVVMMGMGEPFDNFDNALRFLELITDENGQNLSMRHISLSTCGVIPGIERLADLGLQLTLSVSLHAPDSETRSRIMPVNKAYDVELLFDACHRYFQKTGRRISFEYAMIDGVNDSDGQADLLARKIHGMPGHVNLIPLNNVVESEFKPSRRVAAFQKRLESHGITATVRRSLGGDIDASCGQLRRKAMEGRDEA